MILKDLPSFYILAFCCLARFAKATFVTLDLNLKETNNEVQVVNTDHYGLRSVEYYPKDGFTFDKVVQGDLFVWKGGNDKEYCRNAILYSASEPLSLLYLNVFLNGSSVYKYYVKVSGKWREVLEKGLEFFRTIDRKAYTSEQLDQLADRFLDKLSSEVEMVTPFYRNSFSFFIQPIHVCDLEINGPNRIYIMEQFLVGPCFGKIFTPRIDFAIRLVTYKGKQLWSQANDGKFCSSVWTYYKGDFDELIVIKLDDINDNTHSISHICYVKNQREIAMIKFEKFQKLYFKMTKAEYNEKDIQLYLDGYLKSTDIAFIIKPIFAIIIATSAVLYSL